MLAVERDEQAIQEAARLLEEHFGAPRDSAVVEYQPPRLPIDAMIRLDGLVFAVECKSRSYTGVLLRAIDHVTAARNEARSNGEHVIPLVVVPFMGPSGRAACLRAGVNWLDLSGNAHIVAGQNYGIRLVIEGHAQPDLDIALRAVVEGKPNKFKRKGRPKDLFSPAASRIVRWFLLNQEKLWPQHMIAEAVSASESYVSKVVNRLIREGEVARDSQGRLRLVDPAALLQSWRESYDIHKHQVTRGFVFGRSGPELMRQLSERLSAAGAEHAMTGLAGAWLYDHFASFRTVSLYLRERPSDALLSEIGFKEDDKAANVWLILPNDMGVFDGERELEDLPVVHQLQVYLDLKSHAERADEAAEHLLAGHLNWRRGAGR